MIEMQRTIAQEVTFSGKGLHTGVEVTINIKPQEANYGIRFCRIDLEGAPVIAALAENVSDTSRGTTISNPKGDRISTIEHLMAALYSCEIDNALVEINGPEVPILDGSASEYVAKFLEVGTTELTVAREYYIIDKKIVHEDAEKGVKIEIYPDDEFSITVNVDFNSKVVGTQMAHFSSPEQFCKEIAPCRTFVFLHEIMPLINGGLIKGGDIDNAIVIVENPIPDVELESLRAMFGKEDVNVCERGYLNNINVSGNDEIARHKLLDLAGDLALLGQRIKGRVFAMRPGHKANTDLGKSIRKMIKRDAAKPKFKYDVNETPVYDINQIRDILPHRPPFLLIDKIIHIDNNSVVGIKNVTMNEPFFVGHFPNEPVMPGVLQLEAMAQCGGILALHNVDDAKAYSTYFARIDAVKFKRKVIPGDTLMFVLELTEPIRRGMVMMSAKSYVGDTLACEALLVAQVAKTK